MHFWILLNGKLGLVIICCARRLCSFSVGPILASSKRQRLMLISSFLLLTRMVNAGAQVINMSLGGSGYSIAADRAFKRWQSSNNILFVVAAGNDGAAGISTTMYPAAYDGVRMS